MRCHVGLVCAMLVITACVASLLTLSVVQATGRSFRGDTQRPGAYHARQMRANQQQADSPEQPSVLILTPVKNAAHHIKPYFERLMSLSYPHHRLSVALLDSDSTEEQLLNNTGAATTFDVMQECAVRYEGEFNRIQVLKRNFGLNLPRDRRHDEDIQLLRRSIMARSRNFLLSQALEDEDYVLWLDVDVKEIPTDLLETFLSTRKTIVVANCVMTPGGRSYDLNSWKAPPRTGEYRLAPPASEIPSSALKDATISDILQSCARELKLISASNPAAEQHGMDLIRWVESLFSLHWVKTTQTLASLGKKQWAKVSDSLPAGLVECINATAHRSVIAADAASWDSSGVGYSPLLKRGVDLECRPRWGAPAPPGVNHWDVDRMVEWSTGWGSEVDGPPLLLEGYHKTGNEYLHKLRGTGSRKKLVTLDGVGGTALFIKADLHRQGLVFPPFPYRRRIETEGLALMAKDMGYKSYGMPNVEVIHA